jgi:hypothetical protein
MYAERARRSRASANLWYVRQVLLLAESLVMAAAGGMAAFYELLLPRAASRPGVVAAGALFALVALALAAVGLYGVLAFTVARRTAEIGIRMALSAERSEVQRMVIGLGMRIVGIALALGVAAALTTGRLLAVCCSTYRRST